MFCTLCNYTGEVADSATAPALLELDPRSFRNLSLEEFEIFIVVVFIIIQCIIFRCYK